MRMDGNLIVKQQVRAEWRLGGFSAVADCHYSHIGVPLGNYLIVR